MLRVWDYKCVNCSHVFEVLAREGETFDCPKCDGSTERQVAAPRTAFRFNDRKSPLAR